MVWFGGLVLFVSFFQLQLWMIILLKSLQLGYHFFCGIEARRWFNFFRSDSVRLTSSAPTWHSFIRWLSILWLLLLVTLSRRSTATHPNLGPMASYSDVSFPSWRGCFLFSDGFKQEFKAQWTLAAPAVSNTSQMSSNTKMMLFYPICPVPFNLESVFR